MTSNAETMVPQIRAEFERLVTYVTAESHEQTAYTVELTLFQRLLALGKMLLRLFFATRASTRPEAPTLPDGSRMSYHERRTVRYVSVFGALRLGRHYFTATGQAGACPLDAALSLPEHSFSDLVREWAAFAVVSSGFRHGEYTGSSAISRRSEGQDDDDCRGESSG